jgi:uncharacterized protein YycO
MIYSYEIDGLPIQTGDIVCTTDGGEDIVAGQFWRLLGRLAPGAVDHVAVYVGPEGRFVEAGMKGVVAFEVEGNIWLAAEMSQRRRQLIDTVYGVAYPVEGQGFSEEEKMRIRNSVGDYCLAQVGKPYNLNFFDPDTEDGFYCSQLPYLAYLPHGIDLNTGMGVPDVPGTSSIVFPQEIWSGCSHRRVIGR